MAEVEVARDAISGSISLFLGTLVSTIITAVTALILARLLGPSDYGIYALCLVLPTIVYQLLDFGIGSGVSHYTAFYLGKGDHVKAAQVTKTAIIVSVSLGILYTVITLLLASYFATSVLRRPNLTGFVQLGAFIVLAQTIFYISTAVYIGWNLMRLSSMISIIQSIIRLGVTVTLLVIGFGISGAISGYVLSFLVAGSIAMFFLFKSKLDNSAKTPYSIATLSVLMRYGAPIFAGNLVYISALQYVPIILATISTAATIGYYQAAANITTSISLASLAISWSLLRAFSNLNSSGGNMTLALKYSVKYVGVLMTPVIIFIVPTAGNIIQILYGHSYSNGAVYLQLLALSFLPLVLGYSVINPFFSAVPKTKFAMSQLIASGSSIFITTTFFGYYAHYGPEGVLFGLVISNFVWAVLGLSLSSRFLKANIDFLAAGGVVLASLGAAVIVVLIGILFGDGLLALLIELLTYSVTYLTLIPIIGVLNDLDLARLASVLEKPGKFSKIVSVVLNYEKALSNWRRRTLSNFSSKQSQSAFVTEPQ